MEKERAPCVQAQIFVVDDDLLTAGLIEWAIDMEGYRSTVFGAPEPVLDAIRSGADVGLLITDLNLGRGMCGLDLAQEVRRLRPGLPVMLVTGVTTVTAPQDIIVIHKPFQPAVLAAAARRCLTGTVRPTPRAGVVNPVRDTSSE